MPQNTVQITGLDKLIAKLEKLAQPDDAREIMREAVLKAVPTMEEAIKMRVPIADRIYEEYDVPPGLIRDSITHEDARSEEVKVYVGPSKSGHFPSRESDSARETRTLTKKGKPRKNPKHRPLGPYIVAIANILEFGKSTRTAHPFMRPAFAAVSEKCLHIIEDHIKKWIEALSE